MALTTFVIALLFIIALSNLLDSAFPTLPLSLIQIGLGALIALTPINIHIDLQPEIFLGILIAPLLYREAEEADLSSLWKVRKEVVFLVFGLVFVTVIVIGFSADFFLATVPLAACFCLGGILGPTDPVAVKSVYSRIDIDETDMHILKGESLINDASGVIAFSFAAIALTTGDFPVAKMSLTFVYMCIVGVFVGLAIVTLKNFILRSLRHTQVQNSAAFMIIEMLVPFICFFVAQEIGASGILAAVAAGTRQALLVRRVEIFEARFAVIKRSLWDIVKGIFNSFIFILLGLELPRIVISVQNDVGISVPYAMKIGVLVTGVMFAVRYLGVVVAAREKHIESVKERRRNQAVLTLSGVKGTVSLATAFALPAVIADGSFFIERDLLLLITACAIIYSLVIANVVLPFIAKARVHREKNEGRITVLKEVIERIEKDGSDHNEAVVMRLKRRVLELELEDRGKREIRRYRRIRNEFFNREMLLLEKKYLEGEYTRDEYVTYARVQALLGEIQNDSVLLRYRHRLMSALRTIKRKEMSEDPGKKRNDHARVDINRVHEIFWEITSAVIQALEDEEEYEGKDLRLFSNVVEERIESSRTVLRYVSDESTEEDPSANIRNYYELKKSYDIERDVIFEFLEDGRITEEEADDLRVQINTLENFTIEEMQNDSSTKMYISGRRLTNRGKTNGRRK